MTLAEFKCSLAKSKPPTDLARALVALWWAGKEKWDEAHDVVMDEGGPDSAWVHAYLHRVEGDLDNAGYWYGQANRPIPTAPLATEWGAIAETLLATG